MRTAGEQRESKGEQKTHGAGSLFAEKGLSLYPIPSIDLKDNLPFKFKGFERYIALFTLYPAILQRGFDEARGHGVRLQDNLGSQGIDI
ncbi:hypothetical protein GCM10025772_14720 [Ferrimonas gelatinilytica]|uniref:Uncharacterized protein n=1 Tax=Ferrimonas gelatinilytica TaxID=1255257 RepID=A0ABP9S4K9_9GAMM